MASPEPDTTSIDALKKKFGLFRGSPKSFECEASPEAVEPTSQPALLTGAIERCRPELECAACMELLFEPVLLGCGHSFCRRCLAKAFVDVGDSPRRRCPSCRQNLCGCATDFPINIVLWNVIRTLYPAEVTVRRREVMAEAAMSRLETQKETRGEDGGRHSLGYALLMGLEPDESDWTKLGRRGFGATATHSIVLDAEDQTRQISLSLAFTVERATDGNKSRFACLDDVLWLNVFVLNVEEDEAPEGLPLLFSEGRGALDEDDDGCLVSRSHSGSMRVRVTAPGLAFENNIDIVQGQCRFSVPFGDEPGAHMVTIIDVTTKAECRLMLPIAPCSGEVDGGDEGEDEDEDEGNDQGEDDAENDSELDHYEDDGFVVLESDGEGSDQAESTCAICGEATDDSADPVLICDGCDAESHLQCTTLTAVPDGDWYCQSCAPADAANDCEDEGEDEEAGGSPADSPVRPQRSSKRKRRSAALLESDSD